MKCSIMLHFIWVFTAQGGTLIFSYIHRLRSFLGFRILKFNYLFFFGGGGGVQKNECFFEYEEFVDIFWGHHKIGLYLGFHGLVQNGDVLGVGKISNFLGVLEIPDIFGGER